MSFFIKKNLTANNFYGIQYQNDQTRETRDKILSIEKRKYFHTLNTLLIKSIFNLWPALGCVHIRKQTFFKVCTRYIFIAQYIVINYHYAWDFWFVCSFTSRSRIFQPDVTIVAKGLQTFSLYLASTDTGPFFPIPKDSSNLVAFTTMKTS